MNLQIKKVVKVTKISNKERFGDIQTSSGNFVLAESGSVVHNSHICCLLFTMFLKLTPKLIDAGYIYKADLPLYGVVINKQFIPFYNDQDKDKFILENPNVKIQRYKGLGEMDPYQLKVCLLDQQTRHLVKLTPPKDPNTIFSLMTNPELKRKLV